MVVPRADVPGARQHQAAGLAVGRPVHEQVHGRLEIGMGGGVGEGSVGGLDVVEVGQAGQVVTQGLGREVAPQDSATGVGRGREREGRGWGRRPPAA